MRADARDDPPPLFPTKPGPAFAREDWLVKPANGRISRSPPEPSGGATNWIILVILLLALAGAAAWYFLLGSGAPTSTASAPVGVSTEASDPSPTAQQNLSGASVIEPAANALVDPWGAESFRPAEPLWARASGLRYREAPSSADDVPIIAETVSGGEPLNITGLLRQPDGEWFRVAIDEGRAAYFKASLATNDLSTIDDGAYDPALDGNKMFSEIAPRVLGPTEGSAFSGGAQTVEISWHAPLSAVRFEVELETYDSETRRWIQEPSRRFVETSTPSLRLDFPLVQPWRWRVKGFDASGREGATSRWSAFHIAP